MWRLEEVYGNGGNSWQTGLVTITLDHRLKFPDPRAAGAEGLVAIGGDLSVSRLLLAYRNGLFPWTVRPITWWSPDPRGIFELEQFHVPQSLDKLLRKGVFQITRDRAFQQVMEACAVTHDGGNWITPEFIRAYTQLHCAGHAHSLECWQGEVLAGGIYGVSIGGFFAGESMFHRVSNASKVALYHLVHHLRERGFALFDIQMLTPVTRQLGAVTIPRAEYLKRLGRAVEKACRF